MRRYSLAEHVFVCLNDEHVVLLDLKQDRYWALEASKTAALGTVARGWPVQLPAGADDAGAGSAEDRAAIGANAVAEASSIVEVLLGRGLLSDAAAPGKDATPVSMPRPLRELVSDDDGGTSPVPMRTMAAFLAGSAFAKFALRVWPFERVIQRVRQRKQARGSGSEPLDMDRVRQLVQAFDRLRVFVFSSKNECLYDSLALLEFLARHDVFPDWVFGVQARPFAAHCWVQQDGSVFNDTVEHVSGYTAIMVV